MGKLVNHIRKTYAKSIDDNERLRLKLQLGYANWDNLLNRLEKYEDLPNEAVVEVIDEEVWTFLLGCGYGSSDDGIRKLASVLTKKDISCNGVDRIWVESLPVPPRKDENSTHLDMALGHIEKRKNIGGTSSDDTKSGIKLKELDDSWICFCEMKWDSDISTGVTNDKERNQLIRIIENAIAFQDENNNTAKDVIVTLVTPEKFKNYDVKSRLYQYKLEAYQQSVYNMINDINNCKLKIRNHDGWEYPKNIFPALWDIKLNWVSYEELFENMPTNPLNSEIRMFWNKYKKK